MNLLLPDTWRMCPLRQLVTDVQPGFAQRPAPDKVGTPQLRTNNVSPNGQIDLTSLAYVRTTPKDIEQYGVRKGDVIFNNTNSIEWVGKTAYFGVDTNVVLSNHMTRIRVKTNILHAEYLAHYLHFLWSNGTFRRSAKQWVNQAAIDKAELSRFEIILPTLLEQHRIISVLYEAHELRRLRHLANARADQILPALFHDMFEAKGQIVSRTKLDSVLQRPGGIITGPFGSQLKVGELVNSGHPVYGIENVLTNRFVSQSDKYITPAKYQQLKRYNITSGDVLLTRMGTIGRACVVSSDVADSIISYHLFRLRPRKDLCLPEFLSAALNYSPSVRHQLINYAPGAVMSGLNSDTIRSLDLPLPSPELQRHFVRIVKAYDMYLPNQVLATEKADTLFSALISRAFTGELTENWRTVHIEQLRRDAEERDAHLINLERVTITELQKEELDYHVGLTLAPAISQLVSVPIPPEALFKSIQSGPLADFSNWAQRANDLSRDLINNSIFERIRELEEQRQLALANMVQPISAAQQWFSENSASFVMAQSFLQNNTLQLAEQMARTAQQLSRVARSNPRHYLLRELSETQYNVFTATQLADGYFTVESLSQALELDVIAVQNALQLLSGVGLVIPLSLSVSPTPGVTAYITAYRATKPQDDARPEFSASSLSSQPKPAA